MPHSPEHLAVISTTLAGMYYGASAGHPILAVAAAHAHALTNSLKEHIPREEYERFIAGEFLEWCMKTYDGEPKTEGGDA